MTQQHVTFSDLDSSTFSTIFLPATLVIINLGLGMTLTIGDFRNILLHPVAVITGLVSQLVLLPGLAFLIASLSGFPPIIQAGIVLIAACPGGATSNLITHLFKGNVALSISLTTVNSLITVLSIPIIVNLALSFFIGSKSSISLPFLDTLIRIITITLLPVIVGMVIKAYRPWIAEKSEKPLRIIMPLLLGLVFGGVILLGSGDKGEKVELDIIQVGLVTFLLNILGMFMGYGLALLLKQNKGTRMTIGIEVGLQNSTLAIFVAETLLAQAVMAKVAVIYGSFTFFTAVIFAWLFRDRSQWNKPGNPGPNNSFPNYSENLSDDENGNEQSKELLSSFDS